MLGETEKWDHSFPKWEKQTICIVIFLYRTALSFPGSLTIDIVIFLASMVKAGRYQMSETMTLDRFMLLSLLLTAGQ